MTETITVNNASDKLTDRRWNRAGVRSFLVFGGVALALFVVSMVAQYHMIAKARQSVVGDGRHVETYGFDLSNFELNRAVLVASGQPKGAMRTLDGPDVADAEEVEQRNNPRIGSWARFIVPSDNVVGVVINGEARAYPLRTLNWHEIVNDTVGGVPITVVYSSLTHTAVAFERTVGGSERSFGFSGLLYNSSPVVFDRQAGAADESLWAPLLGRAIAGPAKSKGQALKLLPCSLVKWGRWHEAHPDSSVIMGLKAFKKHYKGGSGFQGKLPYSEEFERMYPAFAVERTVEVEHPSGYRPLDTIVATRGDDGAWRVHGLVFDETVAVPTDRPTVHTRWYVWYALYGDAGVAVSTGE